MNEQRNDDDVAREIRAAFDPAPAMPAAPIWNAIEAADRAPEPLFRRRIQPRVWTALAASLALFLGGAAVGWGIAASAGPAPGPAVERVAQADGGSAQAASPPESVTWF